MRPDDATGAVPAKKPTPAAKTVPAMTAPAQPVARPPESLVPEAISFIPDRACTAIHEEYMAAANHKALAISTGPLGFSTGQADDATAKSAALDTCQKHADSLPVPRKCELYAVATPSSIPTAGRRCRSRRGSRAMPPSAADRGQRHPADARRRQGQCRKELSAGTQRESLGDRAVRRLVFQFQPGKRPTRQRVVRLKSAAAIPASPA